MLSNICSELRRLTGGNGHRTIRQCVGGILLAAALLPSVADAQVQRSYLNPSFESTTLTAENNATGCYVQTSDASVPGWNTTHRIFQGTGNCLSPLPANAGLIELWRTNFLGVIARDANNFAELNAEERSRMFQNVCLINGETINWRFSHRGRGSATTRDVMDYNIGASAPIVRVGTTSNGSFDPVVVSQGAAAAPASGGNGWVDYSGSFNYAGGSGVTSMGFEAVTAAGGATVGNFLDNIQIELAPFVEFVQASSSTPESASNNRPTLRVDGTTRTGFTVTVNITGGTATLGTDYTTPGNSTTMTVTVPAGTYDGVSAASLFALPITITQDTLVESNETIQLQIQPPSGTAPPFLLRSTTTCGGPAQTGWIYTIVDDDSGLTVVKNSAAPVAVAGQPTQFDVVYTIAVNNTSATVAANYALTDTPGFDADASIVSANYTLNGGAAVALPTATPWTLQPQWRALAGGQTDTYLLTVRINIARGGSTTNDTCAVPSVAGGGLHNSATATLQGSAGQPNRSFSDDACENTPTPVWATLTKTILSRAASGDQFQIRILSAGTAAATATTSGAATTATTGTVVLPAGNTLQFDEALAAGGVPSSYVSSIACSNARSGSTTVLPSGPGTDTASRRQWREITPAAGDDISCTITNASSSIMIVKDAVPNDDQDFSFTTTGTGLVNFQLDDDSNADLPNTRTFAGLSAGSFSVTETALAAWVLTSLRCTGDADNGSVINLASRVVTIDLDAGENIVCTFVNSRLPTIELYKTSSPGTGIFNFDVSNADTDVTSSATGNQSAAQITTRTAGTPERYDASGSLTGFQNIRIAGFNAPVVMTEARTAAFRMLAGSSCTVGTSGATVTQALVNDGTTAGSMTLTPPAGGFAPGSTISCTFLNGPAQADLSITKTNNTTSAVSGAQTTYSIVVANGGPDAAGGAVLRDPAATGLQCTAVTCGSATGGAVCPAVDIATLQGAGVTIPTLPANSSLTFSVQCTVQ